MRPDLAPAGVIGKGEEETKSHIRVWKWIACMGSTQMNREGFIDWVLYLLRMGHYGAYLKDNTYPVETE